MQGGSLLHPGDGGRSCSFPQVPVSQVPKLEQEESQLETGTDEQGASGQASCAPHRPGRPGGHGPEVWAQLQERDPCLVLQLILPTHPHWKRHSSRASARVSAAVRIRRRLYKSGEDSPHNTHAHFSLNAPIRSVQGSWAPIPHLWTCGLSVPHLCRQTSGPLPSLGPADTAPSEGLRKCSSPEKGFPDSVTEGGLKNPTNDG